MARRPKDDASTPRERDLFLDDIGARVKAARMRAGLTQKALALKIGSDASWVHLLEDGQQNAQIRSLSKVANALAVTLHALIPSDPAAPGSEAGSAGGEIAAAVAAKLDGAISALHATASDLSKTLGEVHRLGAGLPKR